MCSSAAWQETIGSVMCDSPLSDVAWQRCIVVLAVGRAGAGLVHSEGVPEAFWTGRALGRRLIRFLVPSVVLDVRSCSLLVVLLRGLV